MTEDAPVRKTVERWLDDPQTPPTWRILRHARLYLHHASDKQESLQWLAQRRRCRTTPESGAVLPPDLKGVFNCAQTTPGKT